MLQTSPLNDSFIEPVSSEWEATISLSAPGNQRVVAVVLDFMLLDESSFSLSDKLIFGSDGDTNWWFDVDVPAAGTSIERTLRFATNRNSVLKSSSGTIEIGQRVIAVGVDDGETVSLALNGVAQTPSSAWTAAQAAYPIVSAGIIVCNDPTLAASTPMRLYEAMIRANDVVIAHFRIRPTQSGSTVADLSGHGAVFTIPSPSGYAVRSIWEREPAMGGVENLPWP